MEITGLNLSTLGTAFKKIFLKSFGEVKATYQRFTVEVPSTTSANDYGWLRNFPGMREWIGSRIIKELSGHDYSIKNRKFEATVRVKKDDIDDDNLGLYRPMVEALAVTAAQHPDDLVWETLEDGTILLCFDGQPFFDEDHPIEVDGKMHHFSNYQPGDQPSWYLMDLAKPLKPMIFQNRKKAQFTSMTGEDNEHVFMNGELVYGVDARYNTGFTFPQLCFRSNAALTAENLEAAILTMNGYTNEGGRPLGIIPKILVVGASNQFEADRLIKRATLQGGEDNIHAGRLEVFVAPKLR